MTGRYKGSCQCGAVTYETTVDLDRTAVCNCSRCSRLGWIVTFTDADAFELKSGDGNLSEYLFNHHVIHHLFCKTCGIESFARGMKPDGTPTVAVNVRCLEGVDLAALTPMQFDGKSL